MRYLILFTSFLTYFTAFSQEMSVSGTLFSENLTIDENVKILVDGTYITETTGRFSVNVPIGKHIISFESPIYSVNAIEVNITNENIDLGLIDISSASSGENRLDIPTINISDEELSQEQELFDEIPSLLDASRDAFQRAAAFNFSQAGFRIRGLDGSHTHAMINGVSMNNLEGGFAVWSNWSGLNDVFRSRINSNGLNYFATGLGGSGGNTNIDIRASKQWKQTRITYSNSNRSYAHRLMGTYSTGEMDNGWSFSISGSRRWANEAYVPGSFIYSTSYYAGVEKKINNEHRLSFTIFGAPNRRGRGGVGTQEMYEITGSNYYNPNWGYQNGKKRNARVADSHQPMSFLTHEWTKNNVSLMTTLHYQTGRYGLSALNWYEGPDPRPDYYRKWPSYILAATEDLAQAEATTIANGTNENLSQIDWDKMYEINKLNRQTVTNANGVGVDITGNRALYMLEERRFDIKKYSFTSNLEATFDDMVVTGGLSYDVHRGNNFKIALDLLGADFYVDVDRFIERDFPDDFDLFQSDLNTPNKIIREGNRFGYDYDVNINQAQVWGQGQFILSKFDITLGAKFTNTNFWRVGNIQNGRFPNSSLGESEKSTFSNLGLKGSFSYKIDGRNYINANALLESRAPYARNAFVSPRTRNQLVDGLTSTNILSADLSYNYTAPGVKFRLTGYMVQLQDQFTNRSFFLDNAIRTETGTQGGFVNYILTGVDSRNLGVELSSEVTVAPGVRVSLAGNVGNFQFTSRPSIAVYLDNEPDQIIEQSTSYIKNFYIPNRLQTAATLGINYSSPQFWFASLNANYFDRLFIDFFPERRTLEAISLSAGTPVFTQEVVLPSSELGQKILQQEGAGSAFSLDFFGGKSFLLNDYFSQLKGRMFLRLGLGVNNILDNQDIVRGGFEQYRFDFDDKNLDFFPNKYFYAFGRTYFLNLTLSF